MFGLVLIEGEGVSETILGLATRVSVVVGTSAFFGVVVEVQANNLEHFNGIVSSFLERDPRITGVTLLALGKRG
jgi:hypothetical protein